jgi:hypothetical protein
MGISFFRTSLLACAKPAFTNSPLELWKSRQGAHRNVPPEDAAQKHAPRRRDPRRRGVPCVY